MNSCENVITNDGFAKPNNFWLGRQVVIQTDEALGIKEMQKVEQDILEIQQLLDEFDGE